MLLAPGFESLRAALHEERFVWHAGAPARLKHHMYMQHTVTTKQVKQVPGSKCSTDNAARTKHKVVPLTNGELCSVPASTCPLHRCLKLMVEQH